MLQHQTSVRYFGEGHPFTRLDQLTVEAVLNEKDMEPTIAHFLSEDSIIARTRDCKSYFRNHVTASAVVNKNISVSDCYDFVTAAVLMIIAAACWQCLVDHCY